MEKVNLKDTEFPLYKYYVSPKFIIYIMKGFKNFPSPEQIKKFERMKRDNETIVHINIDFEKDKNFLLLSDYFNQEARMKASFLSNISPWEYFQKHKDSILSEIGESPDFDIIYDYLWKNTKMCSTFPITVVKTILKIYKPKKILDPCAGWGDRMLACISEEISYTGVDPNSNLVGGYKNIIDFFGAPEEKFKFINQSFLDMDKDELGKYDMIITSPPFFNMERYSQDKKQSDILYPDYQEWIEKFLFKLFKKCIKCLEPKGKLIFYINNIKNYPMLNDIKKYLSTKKVKEKEKVTWNNSKYTKIMYVYEKTS